MDNDKVDTALDDATLEGVNGAGLIDSLGRIADSATTDLKKGLEIGKTFGTVSTVVGGGIGTAVGIISGIKKEIISGLK